MRPAQAMALMNTRTEALAAGAHPDPESLIRAAKMAATKVSRLAVISGHQVNIKVMAKTNGVRISVSGPKAHRYRAIITEELNRTRPETKADIVAQLTRKIR